MRFTIVTPVMNGMPWLPETVNSVAQQRTDVDVEHIVLDAGSTDGSREWLLSHPELRCELVFEPDGGQTDAIARGFARASGEILGWLNADDLLEPGALARVSRAFEDQPDLVMVTGACLFIDASGAITGAMPTPPEASLETLVNVRMNPPQPSTFFTAAAYRQVGGMDTRYDLAMDLDLWLRLARHGRFTTLPDAVLSRFRIHPAAKTERWATRSAREDMALRRQAGMSLRSPAGRQLIREGYIRPILGPVRRRIQRVVVRALSGSKGATK